MSTPDKNLHSIANRRPLGDIVLGDIIADPAVHSDALKVTDCADGYVLAGRVVGGKEDCCDVNNHTSNVIIAAELWEPRGLYGFTIKGGSDRVMVSGLFKGHGRVADVDIGNISDQSDNPTTRTKLNLHHVDGDAIRVRIINGDRPVIMNPEQRYDIITLIPPAAQGWFTKIYKLLKRLGLPI